MSQTETPAPFAHWMLREIYEQPRTLAATLERYVRGSGFNPATTETLLPWIQNVSSGLIITASGSSRHAGLVAQLAIENLTNLIVDMEFASEFTYRAPRVMPGYGVLVVSQSGETADTLAALRKANAEGYQTLSITNVDNSTMAREATVSFPTAAGRERAVPATKSFTAQLLNLHLLTLMCGLVRKSISPADLGEKLAEIAVLPQAIERQLPGWALAMQKITAQLHSARSFLFLGRGVHYPIASEGALKLKESAYLHAEGYPSGELKHGPNALISDGTPLAILCTVDHTNKESVRRYGKSLQLLRDMRAQGAEILAIANSGDDAAADAATHTVFVDEMSEAMLAICEVVPLQLLAYYMAVEQGINVDRPRNLTKAVLAE